jgi:triphosphoribosyl-dephospho-CoA synthase
MASLEDTNLLHRGGCEGLEYVRTEAARISELPVSEREDALRGLDSGMTARRLSPGGSADMLALAFLLERWQILL